MNSNEERSKVTPKPQPQFNNEGNQEEPSSVETREDSDFPNADATLLEKIIENIEKGSKK